MHNKYLGAHQYRDYLSFGDVYSIPTNLSPQNHSDKAELIPDSNKREPEEKSKRSAKLRHQRRQWIDQLLFLHPGLVRAGLETNRERVGPEKKSLW